jgi:hypothetical protein
VSGDLPPRWPSKIGNTPRGRVGRVHALAADDIVEINS